MDYVEWDGTHIEATNLWDFLMKGIERNKVEAFCNCVAYSDRKGCCSLVVNDEKVRWGDRIYLDDKVLRVAHNSPPRICPAHKVEHKGTGPYLCITTGEHD